VIESGALVGDAASESAQIEFKQLLPDRSDRGRHEFLKDVCAFANSGGGTIYFGIAEQDGTATSIEPITTESFDDAARRLGQMLDAGIEPRLPGAEFREFVHDEGYVLGLRVPPSFATPHRYLFNGHSKFVMRNNTHVTEMNYDQIRSAFNRSGSLMERAERQWHSEIERAAQRKTWRPLEAGPQCLVQLAPLPSVEVSQIVDIQKTYGDFARFIFDDWGGGSASFNLEGLVVHTGDVSGVVRGFVQIKRNGIVQAYRSARALYRDENIIPSQSVASFIRQATFKFIKYAGDAEIPGPYLLNCALLDVADSRFGLDNRLMFFEPLVADRQHLILPSTYLESLADVDQEKIVRDTLDVLWQSFGVGACTIYTSEGTWSPR